MLKNAKKGNSVYDLADFISHGLVLISLLIDRNQTNRTYKTEQKHL